MRYGRCAVLVLMALAFAWVGVAEEINIESLDQEGLIALNVQIAQTIERMGEEEAFDVAEGTWVVGQELKAGTYRLLPAASVDQAYVTVQEADGTYVCGVAVSNIAEWGNKPVWLRLESDQTVVVEWGSVTLSKQQPFLSLGNRDTQPSEYDLSGMTRADLDALNASIVSALAGMEDFGHIILGVGEWSVGRDIPVTTYNVLAYLAAQSYVEIYNGAHLIDGRCVSSTVGWGEEYENIKLKEGYVVKVDWGSVGFADTNTTVIYNPEDGKLVENLFSRESFARTEPPKA